MRRWITLSGTQTLSGVRGEALHLFPVHNFWISTRSLFKLHLSPSYFVHLSTASSSLALFCPFFCLSPSSSMCRFLFILFYLLRPLPLHTTDFISLFTYHVHQLADLFFFYLQVFARFIVWMRSDKWASPLKPYTSFEILLDWHYQAASACHSVKGHS